MTVPDKHFVGFTCLCGRDISVKLLPNETRGREGELLYRFAHWEYEVTLPEGGLADVVDICDAIITKWQEILEMNTECGWPKKARVYSW